MPGRHDPQALAAEPLVLREERVRELRDRHLAARRRRRRPSRGRSSWSGAPLTYIRTTSLPASSCHLVERGHELVGRVERDLGDARVALAGEDRVHAALRGEHDERALGRVADERRRPWPPRRRTGPSAAGSARARHVARRRPASIWPDRRVALAGDREAPPDDRHLDGGHLVEREGAGLVGVDGRRRAERLDRAQALHDRAGLGERRGPGREDRRDDRRAGRSGSPRRRTRPPSGTARRTACSGRARARSRSIERDAGDDEDLVRQRVELLGERRARRPSAPRACPRCGRPRSPIPVEVTRIVPAPRVTWVFMNAMSTRSPSAASAATASSCLGTGALSPVSADSSISSVAARIDAAVGRDEVARLDHDDVARDDVAPSRRSATSPPRRTRALTTIIFWSAATLASALPSWLRPRKALKTRQRGSARRRSRTGPGRNRLTMPATSSTICIGSRYWRTNACQRGSFCGLGELVRRRTWRGASRPRRRSGRRSGRRAAP